MNMLTLFQNKNPLISFEVFPPKYHDQMSSYYQILSKFYELKPDYVSVTYGAGGSQKDRTLEISHILEAEFKIPSVAHLTCVGHSKEEIIQYLENLKKNNISNILALRGDPPRNQPDFDMSKNEFKYASELIKFIRVNNNTDFCIGAACYPEGHIDNQSIKNDLLNLKYKVECGVDFLVTQLFFDNRIFYDFKERIEVLGIDCPVIPGVMPIFEIEHLKRLITMCGASIPAKLLNLIEKYKYSPEDFKKAGMEYVYNQIDDLLENKVDGIHLLTMNKPKITKEILSSTKLSEEFVLI